MHDLSEQLNEKEHRMHELSALVKRLETEKQELQAAIEEADSALEQGDTKLQQALADQTEQRAETERRLAERESEFETTRYCFSNCFANGPVNVGYFWFLFSQSIVAELNFTTTLYGSQQEKPL